MADHVARDHAGIFVPPPLFYVVPFALGLWLGRFVPLRIVPHGDAATHTLRTVERVGGAALVVAGFALMVTAFAEFVRAKTAIAPIRPATTVVGAGPYRFTRNPMDLGLATAYVGGSLLANALWPLLLLPLVIVAMRYAVIGREERYLEAKFGDEYRRYKSRVRRWV